MTVLSFNSRPDQVRSPKPPLQRRRFLPKQHAAILRSLRYALGISSDGDLPRVFRLPVAVALKPGSRGELAARFDVPGDKADPRRMAFETALALYCRSRQYGYALLTCERRYSIDMEPDIPPGNEDREHGRALIRRHDTRTRP